MRKHLYFHPLDEYIFQWHFDFKLKRNEQKKNYTSNQIVRSTKIWNQASKWIKKIRTNNAETKAIFEMKWLKYSTITMDLMNYHQTVCYRGLFNSLFENILMYILCFSTYVRTYNIHTNITYSALHISKSFGVEQKRTK